MNFVFQYNLKVTYKVTTVNTDPINFQWDKSCTVIQTRGGTQVSSVTKTETTTGGDNTLTTVSPIDFGTIYQSGDEVKATCKVTLTVKTTGSPTGTTGGGTTVDLDTIASATSTETMSAQDKTMVIN